MKTTDNKKIYAVVVVVIVIVAIVAVAVVVTGGDDDDEGASSDVSVLARVNTDGSGIYVKEGLNGEDYATIVYGDEPTDEEYYLGGGDTWVVFNKDAWNGAVFGDPGDGTIQHEQLRTIADLMGLNLVTYTTSSNPTSGDGNLYYVSGVNTYALFLQNLENIPEMAGAFQWEAQFSIALVNGCDQVATTNEMFPGHTCCLVAGDTSFIEENYDVAVRFIAAYIESVEAMTDAIANHVTGQMDQLMEIAINNVTMLEDMTDEEKIAAIESAFSIVVYTYCDDATADDPLADLKDDMAELADDFYASGSVTQTIEDLGFESGEEYAETIVNSDVITDALAYELADDVETATITVSVLTGDIHQLAIHYGIETGIFEEYGIEIELAYQSGGPAAFTTIVNGSADFALLGAPPLTINAINGGYISG